MTAAPLVALDGRTAVIVGAARGLGRAIAALFQDAGADVALADRDAGVAATRDALGARLGVVVDVRRSSEVEALADAAVHELGRLDFWVNCAGVFPIDPVCEMSDDAWRDVLDVNLTGTFYGCRAAARRMRAGGVIVNLTSTSSYRASSDGRAHYVASKHGVQGLTRALARELGPRGIRVVAIAPSLTVTEGTTAARDYDASAPQADFDAFAARLPLRRLGTPDDVARAALFCVSDLAAFVTGSTIAVDGGHLSI